MSLEWPVALAHWVTTRLFLQAFWGFCQCMVTLLNPLAWTVFPKGIWPHQLPGMGRDHCSCTHWHWLSLGGCWRWFGGSAVWRGRWGPWPTLQLRLGRFPWLLSTTTFLSSHSESSLEQDFPSTAFLWLCQQDGQQKHEEWQLCTPQ